MNSFEYLPIVIKQRQEELQKLADQTRQLNAAYSSRPRNQAMGARVLALLGHELSAIGYSLQLQFGEQSEANMALRRESNAGGCD